MGKRGVELQGEEEKRERFVISYKLGGGRGNWLFEVSPERKKRKSMREDPFGKKT